MVYFDYKKGIQCEKMILADKANEKARERFKCYESYRRFWKSLVEQYGLNVVANYGNAVVPGLCEKVLVHALDYFKATDDSVLEKIIVLDPYMKDLWWNVGENVFSWGVVGGRQAI